MSILSRSRAISSTSIRRPAARQRPGGGSPASSAIAGSRLRRLPVDGTRFNVLATCRPAGCRVLHSLRLRAAVFPEPRRRRAHLSGAARATRRASSRRRLRPPIGCAGPEKRASGCCSSSGEERGSDGREGSESGGRWMPVSGKRRADRQPAWRGHARRASSEAARVRARGAFVVSRARRVGDRQAARCARRTADDRAAGRSRSRPHALHHRRDLGRRGAERRVAIRRSRSDVPHRRRRR